MAPSNLYFRTENRARKEIHKEITWYSTSDTPTLDSASELNDDTSAWAHKKPHCLNSPRGTECAARGISDASIALPPQNSQHMHPCTLTKQHTHLGAPWESEREPFQCLALPAGLWAPRVPARPCLSLPRKRPPWGRLAWDWILLRRQAPALRMASQSLAPGRQALRNRKGRLCRTRPGRAQSAPKPAEVPAAPRQRLSWRGRRVQEAAGGRALAALAAPSTPRPPPPQPGPRGPVMRGGWQGAQSGPPHPPPPPSEPPPLPPQPRTPASLQAGQPSRGPCPLPVLALQCPSDELAQGGLRSQLQMAAEGAPPFPYPALLRLAPVGLQERPTLRPTPGHPTLQWPNLPQSPGPGQEGAVPHSPPHLRPREMPLLPPQGLPGLEIPTPAPAPGPASKGTTGAQEHGCSPRACAAGCLQAEGGWAFAGLVSPAHAGSPDRQGHQRPLRTGAALADKTIRGQTLCPVMALGKQAARTQQDVTSHQCT